MVSELQEFRKARSTVHAGASEGARRVSHEPRTAPLGLDAHFARIHDGLNAIWGEARRRMAEAGPLPLAADEEWVEGDDAYRKRLNDRRHEKESVGRWSASSFYASVDYPSVEVVAEMIIHEGGLDDAGEQIGLPRARLVSAPTRDVQSTEEDQS